MSTDEPLLYPEGPEALHTGTPRRRPWLIVGIVGGPLLAAVAAAVALPLVTGSAADQARDSTTVFLAALRQNDTETAYGMLCDAERTRLKPGQVAAAYAGPGKGSIVSVADDHTGGKQVEQVVVRWDDGSRTRLTVVNESGAHICGTTPDR